MGTPCIHRACLHGTLKHAHQNWKSKTSDVQLLSFNTIAHDCKLPSETTILAPNIAPTRFLHPVHIFSSFGFSTTSHSNAESSKSFNSKSSTRCCAARSHDSTTEAYLASQSSNEVSTQDPKDDYISIPCQGMGWDQLDQLIGHGYCTFFWDVSIACHCHFSVNPFLNCKTAWQEIITAQVSSRFMKHLSRVSWWPESRSYNGTKTPPYCPTMAEVFFWR